jgi:hypothetical protein
VSAPVIILVLVVLFFLPYLLSRFTEVPPYEAREEPPPDPEKVVQAAVELHRIRRRLETADLKTRQRRDAARLKREIAEALEDEE